MEQIAEHIISTNEIIIRDMTPEELAQFKKDKEATEARIELMAQKAKAKAAAEAKLAALGLTADDLKALGL